MLAVTAAFAQKSSVKIKVIETGDVHGRFFPLDIITGKRIFGTMACVSNYVKRQRADYGDNLILLDNGDITEGLPINYYWNFINTNEENIAASVVNYLKYDAQGVGNHELENGHACYDKWAKEVKCPVICANIINTETNEPYFKPYTIIEKQGVKVAVLGLTTPLSSVWFHDGETTGMRFEALIPTAEKWLKVLKEEEKADIIIGLFHSGYKDGTKTDEFEENEALKVAREVDGFDIIFYGHDHKYNIQEIPNKKGNSCMILNPGNLARMVAEAEITVSTNENGKRETNISCQTVSMDPEEKDQAFMNEFKTHLKKATEFCNGKLGTVDAALYSREAFFGNCPFVDYIHNIQLSVTKADISFNAPTNIDAVIRPGEISVGEVFTLYKYKNKLCVVKMSGKEVRKYLERSYALWTKQMSNAQDHIFLLDESTPGKISFQNSITTFDTAAGIDYEVDVTKPEGEKIKILQMSDGKPFSEDATYNVVMNSFRANDGDEMLTKGAGIAKEELAGRIISRTDDDIRSYIINDIKTSKKLKAKANTNWKFVPEKMAKPALERDRTAMFKRTIIRVL